MTNAHDCIHNQIYFIIFIIAICLYFTAYAITIETYYRVLLSATQLGFLLIQIIHIPIQNLA